MTCKHPSIVGREGTSLQTCITCGGTWDENGDEVVAPSLVVDREGFDSPEVAQHVAEMDELTARLRDLRRRGTRLWNKPQTAHDRRKWRRAGNRLIWAAS